MFQIISVCDVLNMLKPLECSILRFKKCTILVLLFIENRFLLCTERQEHSRIFERVLLTYFLVGSSFIFLCLTL